MVEILKLHPRLGRVGPEPSLRELIIGGAPCIVFYRIHPGQVTIDNIRHAEQRKRS